MRHGTGLVLALCIGSVGPVLGEESPSRHLLPTSERGHLVVGLCDGETSIEVAGVTPGDPMTREQGQKVADALMAEWRRKHPDTEWVVAQAATDSSKLGRGGASPTAVPSPSEASKRQFQTYGAFTERDKQVWQDSTDKLVAEGKRIFHDAKALGGTNAISCDMCHPDGSNTHPETYPKYQVQLGRVALLRDMINWCIENPVRGRPFADDDPRLKALEAYILAQRKGIALEYGKH
jgi:thiosulfate dehydrogenase